MSHPMLIYHEACYARQLLYSCTQDILSESKLAKRQRCSPWSETHDVSLFLTDIGDLHVWYQPWFVTTNVPLVIEDICLLYIVMHFSIHMDAPAPIKICTNTVSF